MEITTRSARFLIESREPKGGCIEIQCTSEIELHRFFGSMSIYHTGNSNYPYAVKSCKQEFTNALILMVKEVDYSDFSSSHIEV